MASDKSEGLGNMRSEVKLIPTNFPHFFCCFYYYYYYLLVTMGGKYIQLCFTGQAARQRWEPPGWLASKCSESWFTAGMKRNQQNTLKTASEPSDLCLRTLKSSDCSPHVEPVQANLKARLQSRFTVWPLTPEAREEVLSKQGGGGVGGCEDSR